MEDHTAEEYPWSNAGPECTQAYLRPALERILAADEFRGDRRLIDVGCGNGSMTAHFAARGWSVIGIEPSTAGVALANRNFPDVKIEAGSAYDDLPSRYGRFPVVLSLEVVEHLYDPRRFAATLFDLCAPGGCAIVSTPYHGYWKNLALALSGKMDAHFSALWDHGHIKFWSIDTLTVLLEEAGFRDLRFLRVGRIPPLAKSMIAIARKGFSPACARRSSGREHPSPAG